MGSNSDFPFLITERVLYGAALESRVEALERKAGRADARYRWAKQHLRRLTVKCRLSSVRRATGVV